MKTLPEHARPKLVLFGESLGAWTSQDAVINRGTQGLLDLGIDYAIWIGTPHFSQWKEQVLHDHRPDTLKELIGVFNDIGEWNAVPQEKREQIRYVMITHHNDGVARFGPELIFQAPEWLCAPADRWDTIPKGMRWFPNTTFFQVLVDMKNSANVVPGQFAATGHDYRADLRPFFQASARFRGHRRTGAAHRPVPARPRGSAQRVGEAARPFRDEPRVVNPHRVDEGERGASDACAPRPSARARGRGVCCRGRKR